MEVSIHEQSIKEFCNWKKVKYDEYRGLEDWEIEQGEEENESWQKEDIIQCDFRADNVYGVFNLIGTVNEGFENVENIFECLEKIAEEKIGEMSEEISLTMIAKNADVEIVDESRF